MQPDANSRSPARTPSRAYGPEDGPAGPSAISRASPSTATPSISNTKPSCARPDITVDPVGRDLDPRNLRPAREYLSSGFQSVTNALSCTRREASEPTRPNAISIVFRIWLVWAVMSALALVPPTSFPALSVPTIPEMKMRSPAFTAVGYGAMGGESNGEATIFFARTTTPFGLAIPIRMAKPVYLDSRWNCQGPPPKLTQQQTVPTGSSMSRRCLH